MPDPHLRIGGVRIERDATCREYEISVLLDSDDTEGSYTFVISGADWWKALERGNGRTGAEIDDPLPWLIVSKKALDG